MLARVLRFHLFLIISTRTIPFSKFLMGEMMGEKKPVQFRRRKLNRLEPVTLNKLKPGYHADGNGLYLVVQDSGSRSWILRTVIRGRRHDIGLGGLSITSLADARKDAAELRGKARKGEDILALKRIEQHQSNAPTFEEAARIVHKDVAPTLKNEHNKTVWIRSLENHVFPVFGSKRVDDIDSADVLRAILPIWAAKPDMARKTLTRIRHVMDWARLKKYRDVRVGDISIPLPNPCADIHKALPKQPKEGRHAALSFDRVPVFIESVRESTSGLAVRLAMEFTILTACRTSEVLEATWDEIDFDRRCWSIPGSRMKMDEAHDVPLAGRSLEILDEAKRIATGKFIFPSSNPNEPLGNVTMLRALKRMKEYKDLTMHGFRASFSTWAHEKTRYDSLVIESCLAHKIEGVQGRYARTTFPEQRKKLMQAWADFATATLSAKIVKIH
jgi:integrase